MAVAAIFDIDGTLVSFRFDAEGVRRAIERIGTTPPETLDHMKKLLANKGSE